MDTMANRSRVLDPQAAPYERKDDGGRKNDAPTDTKKAIAEVMTAFEEFKTANDQRLKELESKKASDPLIDEKLDKINKKLDESEDISQRLTKAEGVSKALEELQEQFDAMDVALKRRSSTGSPEEKALEMKERVNSWGRAVIRANLSGVANLSDDQRKALDEVNAEYKALSVGNDTTGGYLAPLEYIREITKGVTEVSPVRSLVRVRQTSQKGVQMPKRTGQFSAQWTAEQGSRTETDGLRYGQDEINAHELYALVDVSEQNLEDSFWDLEAELREEAAEQFAVAEGAAVINGNGVGKPEGILVNSDVAESVSGGATTLTGDGLITLKYAIKSAYARNATWGMNRSTMGAVRKLKDGDGNYLWIPGIAQGQPNTIDGDPYVELPDMPNVGAGAYPIVYGDFRRAYTMVDRIQMVLLRDPYTQATSGNVRFIMRKRLGGQVVLAEAIRKLKVAAS